MNLLNLLHTKNTKLTLLLIVFYVFLLLIISVKQVYFSIYNVEQGKFVKINNFGDDGGVYISELIVFHNWFQFSDEEWFKQIKYNISKEDLLNQWGFHAPRVKFIFTRLLRDGWHTSMLIIYQFVNDYKESFRLSSVFYPVIVFINYIFLIVISRQYFNTLFPVIYTLVFVDVIKVTGVMNGLFVTSSYGLAFCSIGLVIRFFNFKQQRFPKIISYCFLVIATTFSRIPVPVLIVIIAMDVLPIFNQFYHKVLDFNSRNFLWITNALILLSYQFLLFICLLILSLTL